MSYNIQSAYNSESIKDNHCSDGLKQARKRVSSNHRKDPFYDQSLKFRSINHNSIESGDSQNELKQKHSYTLMSPQETKVGKNSIEFPKDMQF